MKITICSSMVFYKACIDAKKKLEKIGYEVLVPNGALVMDSDKDFNVQHFIQKHYNNDLQNGKPTAIKEHFNKIQQGDALLVINNAKHDIKGYIGPNVLMELGIGFHLQKKLFVLNPIPETSPFIEELTALNPIILNGNLESIQEYFKDYQKGKL